MDLMGPMQMESVVGKKGMFLFGLMISLDTYGLILLGKKSDTFDVFKILCV